MTKDRWYKPLSRELCRRAIKLFKEYAQLSTITFPRSITASGWLGKPWVITFSDRSFRGVVTWLMESRAKLTLLDQKGDSDIAEICGTVFAARLKEYILKHGQLEVAR